MNSEDRSKEQLGPSARIGATRRPEPALAAAELARALRQPRTGLVVVFASSRYDPTALESCLREAFGDTPMIGCTTAGEIGPDGYQENGLAGVSLGAGDLDFEVGLLENLSGADQGAASDFAHGLRERLMSRHPGAAVDKCFAYMLIDGVCGREEMITHAFYTGLGGIALAGGSAGDDLAFKETRVLFNGRFFRNAALLLVATTPHPFAVFKTQHIVSTGGRMVVTGAVPERRVVTEINGYPAAEEYARVIGVDGTALRPQAFADHPVVVRIGDADFVRSIQQVNPDRSLSFFCAIDRGIVFQAARGADLLANLDAALDDAKRRIGPPAVVLGCDCILRRLECQRKDLTGAVGARLAAGRVVGFSTFGEQFRGMHINQTFTGIALGAGRGA